MKGYLFTGKTIVAVIALAVFQVLAGGVGHAASVIVNAEDRGWYNGTEGFHDPTLENYAVGEFNGIILRNWFVFDLSVVTDSIINATLRLPNPAYVSPDSTETYNLYDVTTSIASLTAGGINLFGTFNDLGSGTQYGSQTVSDSDTIVDISINAAGLTALNGASGLFALGGSLSTIGAPVDIEIVFGLTQFGDNTPQLVLETEGGAAPVPEPSTMILLGSGMVGFLTWQTRKFKFN